MNELAQTAMVIAAILGPHLPSLLYVGEEAGKEIIKKTVDAGWEKAREIWTLLHPKVTQTPALQAAADGLAEKQLELQNDPDNLAMKKAVETYQTVFVDGLNKLIRQDPEIALRLSELMRDETVQRLIARHGSEIQNAEQSVVGGGKGLQEQIAEDGSKIIGGVQQVDR